MPMNAPVTATTGTDRTPTSYICGNSSRRFFHWREATSQRKVRAAKMEKSPNAASVLLTVRPTFSMVPTGMGANDMNRAGSEQTGSGSARRCLCQKTGVNACKNEEDG